MSSEHKGEYHQYIKQSSAQGVILPADRIYTSDWKSAKIGVEKRFCESKSAGQRDIVTTKTRRRVEATGVESEECYVVC